MKQTHRNRGLSIALATLGLAAILPTSAFAACPAVGDSRMIGTCEPREFCERQVVVERKPYGGGPGFVVSVYHRNNSGWYYYGWAHHPCSQW